MTPIAASRPLRTAAAAFGARRGPGDETAAGRLYGLETGRFVAALLVACFHYSFAFLHLRGNPIFGMAFLGGHAGVEYFFVLSGFILFHVHHDDIGKPHSLRDFLVKRLIRIYPIYWLMAAVSYAGFAAFQDIRPDLVSVVTDLLLLPSGWFYPLTQSWSLRHEIVFYAIFALAIVDLRAGAVVFLVWQAASLVVGCWLAHGIDGTLKPFVYLYNIGFGLGVAASWVDRRYRLARPGVLALIGLALFACGLVAEWHIGDLPATGEVRLGLGDIASPMLYIAASTLIVIGVTQYEERRPLPRPDILAALGACSFVLYLQHTFVGSVTLRLFNLSVLKAVPDPVVFVVMLVVAVTIAMATHRWVEKPMLGFLRERLLGPKRRLRSPSASPGVAEDNLDHESHAPLASVPAAQGTGPV